MKKPTVNHLESSPNMNNYSRTKQTCIAVLLMVLAYQSTPAQTPVAQLQSTPNVALKADASVPIKDSIDNKEVVLKPRSAVESLQGANKVPSVSAPPKPLFDAGEIHPDIAIKETKRKEIVLPGVMKIDGENLNALNPSRSRRISMTNGGQVTLLDNGTDSLTLNSNGRFFFPAAIASGGSYQVTISSNPTGQTCSLAALTGSGSGVNANVSNISVVCSANAFKISGTITGLDTGAQLTLLDNGADPLKLSSNGSFVFPTPIAQGGSYQITISSNPMAQTCSISNQTGSGAGITANVTNVAITCSDKTPYIVGGSITGLLSGETLTVLNNGSDSLTISQNGNYVFPTPIAPGGSYAVTIGTQPSQQNCALTANTGAGTNLRSNVINANIVCSVDTYSIGGSVSGLPTSLKITIQNNLANPMTVGSGTFTFTQPSPYDSSYSVTTTQPTSGFLGHCEVKNGTGTVLGNVSTVSIGCNPPNIRITTLAGPTTRIFGLNNGNGAAATFNMPYGMVFDNNGNMYVADYINGQIRRIDPSGNVTLFAGPPSGSDFIDGSLATSIFNGPTALAFDASGNLYVTDQLHNRIMKIDTSGNITVVAGTPSPNSIPAPSIIPGIGTAAVLSEPQDLVFDSKGFLYFTDYTANQIGKIDLTTGTVTVFAGSPTGASGASNGNGTAASFYWPAGMAISPIDGNFYVADLKNNQIRKITPAGDVSLFAGDPNGKAGNTDGVGTSATFTYPLALRFDSSGNLYLTSYTLPSSSIRIITPDATVTTIENLDPTSTGLNCLADGLLSGTMPDTLNGIVLAPDGSGFYVSDYTCNSIRKITLSP